MLFERDIVKDWEKWITDGVCAQSQPKAGRAATAKKVERGGNRSGGCNMINTLKIIENSTALEVDKLLAYCSSSFSSPSSSGIDL